MNASATSELPATGAFSPLGGAAPHANAIELYATPSADFDIKLHETVVTLLKAAATGPVTQANSLGAEDMVLTHLINSHTLPIEVFVLDTGALHPETLALLQQLQAQQAQHPHAPLTVLQPHHEAVVQFVAREGTDAMYRSIALRKACCHIRKMEPLARALAGKKAWVTGLRREQSGARADVDLVDRSELESKNLLKYNPLANWSWGDVWHYIATRQVPYNPLHDQFTPSIGCAPCTRAITLGEDFRSGRWWWENEDAKECGLHVKSHSVGASAPTGSARSVEPASEVSAQAHIAAGDVKDAPASGRSQNGASPAQSTQGATA
jgi:phosphoadenosine phosphosulfate reductase